MAGSPLKLKLPWIREVSLHRFSLFEADPNPKFSCGPGVLCLVGANGIGKSTLLSAINFCLTGIVPDPDRKFESMDEFYKYTQTFSSNYFRGRILGTDEDDAEVTVRFSIGAFEYDLCRGLFEPQEVRSLTILNRGESGPPLTTDGIPRSERHKVYAGKLVEHSGLTSFEEFVFLQHLVFTFDEQRNTLFWDSKVMERVLYRAFGWDSNMAKKADGIRREIQHEDSRVRNRQWEATRMQKRIREIRAQSRGLPEAQRAYDTLVSRHETLTRQFEEDSKLLEELDNLVKDATLTLAERSVREAALREEYTQFFELSFQARPLLAQHPMITTSIADHMCGLCGNRTDEAQSTIAAKSKGAICPLCNSPVAQEEIAGDKSGRLQEIDQELARVRNSIKDVHRSLENLNRDLAVARKKREASRDGLDEFDRQNEITLDNLRGVLDKGSSESSLADYRHQLALIEKEKKIAYDRREDLKQDLLNLQKELEQQYLQVEKTFVPMFSGLAEQFLGMPLTVQLEARTTGDLRLIVTVRGTTRRQRQHLSESQRFFLDIALRMALVKHMSDPTSSGGLVIDTPEGSLDIAYEKRAGDMMAKFSNGGHQIIMTANLNTSKLLIALARNCGRDNMRICRMMDWAELSEVQQEEEPLFDEAYREIEEALDAAPS